MRTTLDVDKNLLQQAMKTAGLKSQTAAVNRALEEFVRRQKLKGLLQLEGAIDMQDNWREMEEEEIKQIRKERRSRRGSR